MNLLNLGVAFGAGMISVSSPCCLPLLPGYLGYLSGVSGADVRRERTRILMAAALFVLGFAAVFVALGATASVIGGLLLPHRQVAARLAGIFILAMGLVIILERFVPLLSRSRDWTRGVGGGRLWTGPALGAAFAITWTPCIGPVLAAILTLAGSTADLQQGVALLAAYSLGLGLPFLAMALSVPRVKRWTRNLGHGAAMLRLAAGGLLSAMGILLLTNLWLPLMAPFLAFYARAHWPPI